MTMTSGPRVASFSGGEYHLAVKTPATNAGSMKAVMSFMASLDNFSRTDVDLSGLAGMLVDTSCFHESPIVVTIHEALKRHTGPKAFSSSSGAAAQADLAGGVDGRMQTSTRHALLLWLPEIYDESRREAGTRLLEALRDFFIPWIGTTVLVDLGVEDELYGRIFWPKLRKLGLQTFGNGRFATGVWSAVEGRQQPRSEVGFVYL